MLYPDELRARNWSGQRDSNPRPPAPKAGALPGCAIPRRGHPLFQKYVGHHTLGIGIESNSQKNCYTPPMLAHILSGKILADSVHQELMVRIQQHKTKGQRTPALAVILVGDDPASMLYISHKHEACQKIGLTSLDYRLEAKTTELQLLNLIDKLNQDPTIDGILIQLPLPPHIATSTIREAVHFQKDVDGFHPYNMGRLAQKNPLLRSCTPAGIMKLIATTDKDIRGLHAVVVGDSNIVGRPMLLELLMAQCTVTICHHLTQNLADFVARADILVSAVGKPKLIKGEWIKTGAIVIDVGINRLADGTLIGDIEFDKARKRAGFITPVPGGVGPMTIATLLENTLSAYETLHLSLGSTTDAMDS
jgi:methylenetetrahydrofolate dehydrogenase (NADP+)/methenyltetrahydrofolate cyclohydrolase